MKNSTTHTKETSKATEEQLITRKEAIKRTGYMALSATTMMMLLYDSASGQQQTSGSQPAAVDNKSTKNGTGIWDE